MTGSARIRGECHAARHTDARVALPGGGKLTVPGDLRQHVAGAGLRIVALNPEHGLAVAELPLHHSDPFDRLLVAQAMHEGFTLMTADTRMGAYGVAVLDALA